MNAQELQQYENWLKVSPQKVYVDVLAAGGWKNVFRHDLPRWASRVRNYFNVTPRTLTRLPEDVAKKAARRVQRFVFELECYATQTYNNKPQNRLKNADGSLAPPVFKVPAACPAKPSDEVTSLWWTDEIAVRLALTDFVYKDESGRLWYQMAAGSTIYHYGKPVRVKALEAPYVDLIKGQNDTPVYKLINPDNSGGSNEIILKNPGPYDMIGEVGQEFGVDAMLEKTPAHQGSYNYADTAVVGLNAHDRLDMKPHSKRDGFYLNPADRYCPLQTRKFPPLDQVMA